MRYQPMAIARDALNPLGGLRLRVFLKRRADSLRENDEGEQGGDREYYGPKSRSAARMRRRVGMLGSHGRRAVAIGASHRCCTPPAGSYRATCIAAALC